MVGRHIARLAGIVLYWVWVSDVRDFDFPEKIAVISFEELQSLTAYTCQKVEGLMAAYLFGSRARESANPRDYDIAILFDGRLLNKPAMYDATDEVYMKLQSVVYPLDVVALNSAGHVLLAEIFRDKKLLYCKDDAYRRQWEWDARYRMWDMQPYHKLYQDAALDRLRRMTSGD